MKHYRERSPDPNYPGHPAAQLDSGDHPGRYHRRVALAIINNELTPYFLHGIGLNNLVSL